MRKAFPHAAIPKSLYELRKMIRDLGLGYEKIDACPNDCMLYWKENKDKIKCDVCQTSRYKQINNDSENESTTEADNDGDYKAKKVGAKVLHYFPLIPRLQRLFMSSKTAGSMRWHEESRTKDGRLRHPADSPAWKTFDYENKEFAKEPRNVRLGLASDRFNLFGNMSVSHSNNIDVYMQPLVDELKELWDTGVNTYDASTKSYFTLRASLLWTNVCDSLIGTLMNIDGNTKDHLKGRRDLEEIEVKVPDGYAANISRCIQVKPTPKMLGLKSHDNHILMQQLLPVAIRNILPKHVRSVIMKLCRYYRQLCSKVLNPNDLFNMEKDIEKILCDLERIFPPSFFDVMIHLSVHLASEARLGGPVHYRWMYPIDRYLGTLKSYVRNKSKPEGSIAEGYLAEECLSFCSLYLASDVETIHNKTSRNHDDGGDDTVLPIFCMPGRPIGASNVVKLGYDTLAIAHSHVLFNCSEIDFLRTEHLNILSHQNPKKHKHDIQHLHSQEFEEWLSDYVDEDMTSRDNRITSDIETLANGPNVEKNRTTQNSRVILQALTSSFSSAKDNNPIVGDVIYYGVLKDIIELQYGDEKKVVLFHCDWISSGSRIKVDENGFTTLDFRGLKQTKEPYILASQAQQVFYVADPVRKDWKVVIKTTPRDNFDMDEQICIDDVETHLQSDTPMGPQLVENETIDMVRGDLDGAIVDDDTLVAATDKNQIDHDQGRICECSTCVLEQGS
ncbi:uncharacterized protein [Rutidosis leptorrhynchoides]|uniref:uncharacterized protein n=1 Tax=Rutidosis leptorrhynchoides TaxID=125765 RepID=UPI003A999199